MKFMLIAVNVNFMFLNDFPISFNGTCIKTKNSIIINAGIIKYSE